ncbi:MULTISPECIES: hypothetical protein [Streptomyces]|uniref:hypothetical protein n=1 Tax=Streptomyces TaxID=1883 RepID=UPI001428CA46|nr:MULTISPECIES: hypothetical protein [Streptomyces]MDI5904436.1 hypothetical protein [Streptomyces sp. 12257]
MTPPLSGSSCRNSSVTLRGDGHIGAVEFGDDRGVVEPIAGVDLLQLRQDGLGLGQL